MHIHVGGSRLHFPSLPSTSPLPPPSQALKLLRTPVFRPLVVFVKAASPEGVKRLHQSAHVDNPSGHSTLAVSNPFSLHDNDS